MLLAAILDALEAIAPLRYAESWDNVGLIVGRTDPEIARVLLCIDYTDAVAREADTLGSELVVAYHPPIFEGLKRVETDTLIFDAVRKGRALYSPHTALDVAEGGTNDVLAEATGMTGRHPLRPLHPSKRRAAEENLGLGRIGPVAAATRRDVVEFTKKSLRLPTVLVAGPLDVPVNLVAVAAGSAGDMVKEAHQEGAEIYVTGELRHHDALWATARGMTVVCLRHSASERAVLERLRASLAERLRGLDVKISLADQDPFFFH